MQPGVPLPWGERILVFSTFATLLFVTYGENLDRGIVTIDDFDRENRLLELEFLKLKSEALNDDSITWQERVEAWTEKNSERFEELVMAQEALGVPEEPEIIWDRDVTDIQDPVERAMVEVHQKLGEALQQDMATEFREGDDYTEWVGEWSMRNRELVQNAESAARDFSEKQWETLEPIVIDQIDDSEEAILMADAQERMAEKILELRAAHTDFDDFRTALEAQSAFMEEQQTIVEEQRKMIEARQIEARIQELEYNP